MRIRARAAHGAGQHEAIVATDDRERAVAIPPREGAPGSSVNGGELLFLALATCYVNDVYREAARRGLRVTRVEVEVDGEFGGPGEPARDIRYRARVAGEGSDDELLALLRHTDGVAEIHNTLRGGVAVELAGVEVLPG